MLHVGSVGTEPFRRPCGRALALEHLGATNPSLRHPLLVVDRLFRELNAFAHTLLICIPGDHGACSDLCTPPLCPLADIRFNGESARRFLGGATRRPAASRRAGAWAS